MTPQHVVRVVATLERAFEDRRCFICERFGHCEHREASLELAMRGIDWGPAEMEEKV